MPNLVITIKHHAGFCMWDTGTADSSFMLHPLTKMSRTGFLTQEEQRLFRAGGGKQFDYI
jgi:hypothetical protein